MMRIVEVRHTPTISSYSLQAEGGMFYALAFHSFADCIEAARLMGVSSVMFHDLATGIAFRLDVDHEWPVDPPD